MKYGFLSDVNGVDFKLRESSSFNNDFIKANKKSDLEIHQFHVTCKVLNVCDFCLFHRYVGCRIFVQ